jgi:hypothetical protein
VEEPLPEAAWTKVGVDVFSFNGDLFLILVDYYSKWIEAEPIINQTSTLVVAAMHKVFATFGVPKVLRSDNGPCFASSEFAEFAERVGFHHETSSPRYPQSNGMAERAVRTVKGLWSKTEDRHAAMSAYRTTPLASGFTPSELMFGRAVRTPLGPAGGDGAGVDIDAYERKESERMNTARVRRDCKYNGRRQEELCAGDRVWVKAPSDNGSEGVVTGKDNHPNSYWVSVGDSMVRRNRKHLFVLAKMDSDVSGGSGSNAVFNDACGANPVASANGDLDCIGEDAEARDARNVPPDATHGETQAGTSQNPSPGDTDNRLPSTTRSGRVPRERRDSDFVYY